MNNEIKVNLSIVLQGSIMFSKEECLKTTQKVIENTSKKTGKTYKKTVDVLVDNLDMMDKSTIRVIDKNNTVETITVYTRKSKPATQSLNICKDAYRYMVSTECPSWSKPKIWNTMKPKERLEAHLQRITEGLGGVSYTYQIFKD